MNEAIHKHTEQVDQANLDRFQRAAAELGGVTVTSLARAGETYRGSNGHDITVSEGHTGVEVRSNSPNASSFYSKINELAARDAQQAEAAGQERKAA